MQLQTIKVSLAYESETNPRGKDFEDKSFDELVASIKEKGVLVPVLVRPKKKGAKEYEIVAGNRRFRAAQVAGLAEIPANVHEMTDVEAREAQIIENLQRADVHPLDEGEAYRQLIEYSGYEIPAVAARVAKSETYVRQRLFLTNLAPKVAQGFRTGKITDGHAVLIARLSPRDQESAFKFCLDRYYPPTIKQLKEWIAEHIYQPLQYQPWLSDKCSYIIKDLVGACQECPPTNSSLFGDVKEGACTDLKCWTRKMDNYVNSMAKLNKVVKVSKEYGEVPKSVLGRSDYQILSTKIKEHCEFAQQAIVATGSHVGTTLWICADTECKTHGDGHTPYRQSPEEKARRKKEREKEAAKKAKLEEEMKTALAKVKWPLSTKHLDALLDIEITRHGTNTIRPICKRRDVKPEKILHEGGWTETNWDKPLRAAVEKMNETDKLRLLFEITLEYLWEEPKKKFLKSL